MWRMYEEELERMELSEGTSNLLPSLQTFIFLKKKKILPDNHYILLLSRWRRCWGCTRKSLRGWSWVKYPSIFSKASNPLSSQRRRYWKPLHSSSCLGREDVEDVRGRVGEDGAEWRNLQSSTQPPELYLLEEEDTARQPLHSSTCRRVSQSTATKGAIYK